MSTVRLLFIALIMIFLILPGSIDKLQAQGTKIGFTGGMNTSSHLNNFRFQGEDFILDFTPKFSTGFNSGLIFRTGLTPGLRLQAEPSVIILGAKYEESFVMRGFNLNTESKTRLTYFQLPLVLQLSTIPPERTVYGLQMSETTFHLTGGIFVGYLIDSRFSGTNTGAPVGIEFRGDFSNDVRNQYSDFDGGLILGGGIEHGREGKIGFETRLIFSIIDSGNQQEPNFIPQNMGITFGVYFLL